MMLRIQLDASKHIANRARFGGQFSPIDFSGRNINTKKVFLSFLADGRLCKNKDCEGRLGNYKLLYLATYLNRSNFSGSMPFSVEIDGQHGKW